MKTNQICLDVKRTKAVVSRAPVAKRYNAYDFVLTAEGTDEADMDAFAVEISTAAAMAIDGYSPIDLHGHANADLKPEKGLLRGQLLWLPERCPKVEEYAIRGICTDALEEWKQERGYKDVPTSCKFTFTK